MTYLFANSIFRRFGVALVLLLAGVFLSNGNCHASLVLSPDSVVSNTMGEAPVGFTGNTLKTAINGSGLSTSFVSGVTDLDVYLNGNPTHLSTTTGDPATTTFWISESTMGSGADPIGNIVFDLGATYSITDFVLWQNSIAGFSFEAAQVLDFQISISTSSDFTNSTNAGTFNALPNDPPAGMGGNPHQRFNFSASIGQYVRLTINTTQGDSQEVDIGELAFGVNAVPEPTSFILFGIALVGMARRRRWQH